MNSQPLEQPLIKTHNLCLIRQGVHILQDISFAIHQHDFITIIGPNGAGKSMLLKAIMGFFKPDMGIIERQKNIKIGYVPQRLYCDKTLPISAHDFMKLGNKISQDQLDKIYAETGVGDFKHRYLFDLSGGQMQRVLLARALLNEPNLLILDEPAQNLDISGQLAFYQLLDRIYHERNLSILMVSHDLHMVMASSKQVICLFKHICCSGAPQEITKDPQFTKMFGEDMAKMLAVYQHNHNHVHHHHMQEFQHTGDCYHGHS